ncbi:MAG: DUF2069 domain-containing protein [Ideonella sp. MAG2]|nr:MAG: DUF2069 domain-containing protein [Ideonella sp. MAG2]
MLSVPSSPSPGGVPERPSDRVRWTRTVALAAVLGLIVLCLAWELWLAPTGRGTLAIKALPLFFPLVGLWRYRLYTYRWLSLLVWVYCGEGLVRASSEVGLSRSLAVLEIVLCVVLFAACAAQVRWRLAAAKAENTPPPP